MRKKFLSGLGILTLLTFFPTALVCADEGSLISMINDLQKQMAQMQKTINQQNEKISHLEKREPQIQVAPASSGEVAKAAPMSDYDFGQMLDTATGGAQKWLKDLKFAGDLRLRYEAFNYASGHPSETDDRNRFRYRLRFGFEKKFNDDMKIGFGLASGETGASGSNGLNTDPTSTNTSFDNNFNFKPIFIEKAYGTYTPTFLAKRGVLDKTEISGGKVNNPFEKGSSDMVWDRDVKPEGIYEKIDFKLIDSENFKLNVYGLAGQFVLDEDATVGGDANLFAYQMGVNPVIYTPLFERPVDVLQAISLYDFSNYARKSNFLIGSTSLARGNANADGIGTELDAGKFRVIESYSELAIYPHGLPVRFSLDLAGNPADAANGSTGSTLFHSLSNDFAYGLGVKLGGIAKKGNWELGYQYKYIGADSVVGAFNDSDFGDGHAGKRGSVFKAAYAITDSITLNGAMFFVENLNSDTAGVIDLQQHRFQIDLSWKF